MEATNETKENEMLPLPKVKEILENPIRLVTDNYKRFWKDKEESLIDIFQDIINLEIEWKKYTEHAVWGNNESVRLAKKLIHTLKKEIFLRAVANKRANEIIKSIEEEILPEYYVVKNIDDFEKQKENLIKIESGAREKAMAFLDKLKITIDSFDKDFCSELLNQRFLGRLLTEPNLDVAFIKRIYNTTYSAVRKQEINEKDKRKLYDEYLILYKMFKDEYGTYPFFITDVVSLENMGFHI